MKVQAKNLTDNQKIETLDTLYTAASSIKGRDAMKLFLRDLLTESERIMLGRRILIARKLIEKISYESIQDELRVGITTIAKVHRWLEDQLPGYEQAVRGIKREHGKRQKEYESHKTFARLKRKYPLHFLLFPWPKGFTPKRNANKQKTQI